MAVTIFIGGINHAVEQAVFAKNNLCLPACCRFPVPPDQTATCCGEPKNAFRILVKVKDVFIRQIMVALSARPEAVSNAAVMEKINALRATYPNPAGAIALYEIKGSVLHLRKPGVR